MKKAIDKFFEKYQSMILILDHNSKQNLDISEFELTKESTHRIQPSNH